MCVILQLNRAEFENLDDDVRVSYEGFRPGMYVRVEVDKMPCEFVTNFDATYPVILGGLLNVEGNIGYVQVRMLNCQLSVIGYCEILFIRGDPIFVVFVDDLAHKFKIPRITNPLTDIIVTIIFELLPILGCTSIDIG